MNQALAREGTPAADLEGYLACPKCRGSISSSTLECQSCGFKLRFLDGVVSTLGGAHVSYFDDKHENMSEVNSDPGTQYLFYERQAQRAAEFVPSKATVLDVGCGPAVPYTRGKDWFLIGLEPSFQSILANKTLDLRLHGTSTAIPLTAACVDAIFCFYSIHHMTGTTVGDNRCIVAETFKEFGRVLRPGGQLIIFDLSPWWPFSSLEVLAWNPARRVLGEKLDMFFWNAGWLEKLGKAAFQGASFETERFSSNLFTLFAPVFYLPKLKIPRALYPFTINLYRWRLAR